MDSTSENQNNEPIQYDLGLKEPISNKFYLLKSRFSLQFRYFETRRFIRAPHVWLISCLALTLIAVQSYYLYRYIDRLPAILPILKYREALDLRLAKKELLYSLPLISGLIYIFNIYFSSKIFNLKPHISLIAMIGAAAAILLLTLILIKHIAVFYG